MIRCDCHVKLIKLIQRFSLSLLSSFEVRRGQSIRCCQHSRTCFVRQLMQKFFDLLIVRPRCFHGTSGLLLRLLKLFRNLLFQIFDFFLQRALHIDDRTRSVPLAGGFLFFQQDPGRSSQDVLTLFNHHQELQQVLFVAFFLFVSFGPLRLNVLDEHTNQFQVVTCIAMVRAQSQHVPVMPHRRQQQVDRFCANVSLRGSRVFSQLLSRGIRFKASQVVVRIHGQVGFS